MVAELNHPNTGLDIPEHASHISRGGNNLTVVDESAATEITRVGTEFACAPRIGDVFVAVEAVDGANIVQTTASDEVPRR